MRKQPNAMNLPRSNEAEQALTLEAGVQLRSAQGWEGMLALASMCPERTLRANATAGASIPSQP
jgi:hypothetical protein